MSHLVFECPYSPIVLPNGIFNYMFTSQKSFERIKSLKGYAKEIIHYFFPANQQKAGTKIYSLNQCSLNVNEYDWHILAGNDERINSHCLTRTDRQVQPFFL